MESRFTAYIIMNLAENKADGYVIPNAAIITKGWIDDVIKAQNRELTCSLLSTICGNGAFSQLLYALLPPLARLHSDYLLSK